MKVVHCSCCGSFIQPNEFRYIVGVHVTLDVDGCETGTEVATRLAREMTGSAETSLGEVLTKELAFTLCSICRNEFVSNPLHRKDGVRPADCGLLQ